MLRCDQRGDPTFPNDMEQLRRGRWGGGNKVTAVTLYDPTVS